MEKFGKGIHVAAGRCRVENIAQQANGFGAVISAQLYRIAERCRKIRAALAGVVRTSEMCVANDPDQHECKELYSGSQRVIDGQMDSRGAEPQRYRERV